MAKQVKWNKLKIDEFLELSGINYGITAYDSIKCKEMKQVFEMHCLGDTNEKICQAINADINVVKDYIRYFKDVYDEVQPYSKYLTPRINLTKYELNNSLSED